MTQPSGAVAPRTIQGSVVQPSAVIDAGAEAMHGFLNVVRRLVTTSGAFHSESDQDAALTAVQKFTENVIPRSALNALANEYSMTAPKEDVSQRVPPNGAPAGPVMVPGGFDYNKLAQAMLALQQQQHEANQAQTEEVADGNSGESSTN
jgi:hypothetical protein